MTCAKLNLFSFFLFFVFLLRRYLLFCFTSRCDWYILWCGVGCILLKVACGWLTWRSQSPNTSPRWCTMRATPRGLLIKPGRGTRRHSRARLISAAVNILANPARLTRQQRPPYGFSSVQSNSPLRLSREETVFEDFDTIKISKLVLLAWRWQRNQSRLRITLIKNTFNMSQWQRIHI